MKPEGELLDISHKYTTLRTATAQATVTMSPSTLQRIHEHSIPKGDPLEVAKVAAIQAAKQTAGIIPYCHPIPIEYVKVEYRLDSDCITTMVSVTAIAKTGVEMEALTAASVAALTLYDMLKMLDESMTITSVKLLEKRGGKSDYRQHFDRTLTAAVLVMSDSISAGKKSDSSGKLMVERLKLFDFDVVDYRIIPDEPKQFVEVLKHYCDVRNIDLVLTTGGTGFSPRDSTPEAMSEVIEREIPGIPEVIRSFGQARTPYSMLSRAKAGQRGNSLVVNLPGSKKGVSESLDALFPGLLHAFPMIWGTEGWHQGKKTP